MKYAIFVSHELYGTSYITKTGMLVKDIYEAEHFVDYGTATQLLPAMEKKFGYKCYVQTVPKPTT